MVKRLNEAFADEDHTSLSEKKNELRIALGRDKLSWHDFLLHVTGVRKLDTN